MTNGLTVEDYLTARKAMAVFSAEHDIVYQPYDARYKKSVLGTDPVVRAEWSRLRSELKAAAARLTSEESTHWRNTQHLCQEIGHFRHKRDVGGIRFVCITCCCMFDADPEDASLNIYGAEGIYMPGTIDPPPIELRKLQ